MTWVAVDSDGTELISNYQLIRTHKYLAEKMIENYEHKDKYLKAFIQISDCYITGTYTGNNGGGLPLGEEREFEYVDIPKGTIQKLIGRTLTWKDGPVEIK